MNTISQPVGIRNGWMVMPNLAPDMRTITGLLDRIPVTNGGSAVPGLWSTERNTLIAQLAAAITVHAQGTNPVGTRWYVGGRFAQLRPGNPGRSDHNMCPLLLMHGLSRFGR